MSAFPLQVALLGQHNTGSPVDASKPYAELWMGTHPSGPSKLAGALSGRLSFSSSVFDLVVHVSVESGAFRNRIHEMS